MATKEMEFLYEAIGANNTTREVFGLGAGRVPDGTVVRDKVNRISIAVTVRHSDVMGPDPPADILKNPLIKIEKGWPFRTTYDFDWDLEVDGDAVSILGDPTETPRIKRSKEGVTTLLKAKGDPKFLEVSAVSKFTTAGLKLDVPWVEGEGDVIGIGGGSLTGKPVKFLCKLAAEKAEDKSFPRIPDGLTGTRAYFEEKNSAALRTPSIRQVETW